VPIAVVVTFTVSLAKMDKKSRAVVLVTSVHI